MAKQRQPRLELLNLTACLSEGAVLLGDLMFELCVLAFEFAVLGLHLIQPRRQSRNLSAELLNQEQQLLDRKRQRER